jgi:hypothetical protein
MFNFFLASIIAFSTSPMNLSNSEQEITDVFLPDHFEKADFPPIQEIRRDSKELIQKLYRHINKSKLNDLPEQTYFKPSTCLNNELKDLPPGTLVFLGPSEKDVNAITLCLQNGQYCQISTQNMTTILNISDSLTLRKMLGIWTEAKALAIDISFGTQY